MSDELRLKYWYSPTTDAHRIMICLLSTPQILRYLKISGLVFEIPTCVLAVSC